MDHSESHIPDRILRMRELNKHPARTYADPCLFYNQGRFMADFEDHYSEYVPLFDSQPTYEALSDKQLRCYFTWRYALRNGQAARAGLYYIYLYLFELINNIGGRSNFEQLAYVINTYKSSFSDSVPLFRTWFRDYYALNNIDTPFSEIVRSVGLTEIFPYESHDEFEYAYTLRISSLNLQNSLSLADVSFYRFIQCYNTVISNLKILFQMYGLDIESLFNGVLNTDNSWFPYEHAIFYNVPPLKDKIVRLSRFEQYICVRGVWNRRVMSYSPISVSIVNLIVKKIEDILCLHPGCQDKLPAILLQTPYMAVISDRYFNDIIISTVMQCLQKDSSDDILLPAVQELFTGSGAGIVKSIWKARSIPAATQTDTGFARQFVLQAQLLEDCIDNFESSEPLPEAITGAYTYSMLTIPQMRSYLTWRARYKNHRQADVNHIFASIYANELINKIGAESDLDVLEKLAGLIRHNPDISDVFLDYFVTHKGSMVFSDIIQQMDLSMHFPNFAIQNKTFEDWYGIFKDKLGYTPDESIAGMFNICIKKLRDYFENAGLTFMVLFLGIDDDRRNHWKTFSRAVYLNDTSSLKSNKIVSISDYDTYMYNSAYRKWTCVSASIINPKCYYLIGYIVKRLKSRPGKQALPKIQIKRIRGMFPSSSAFAKYINAIISEDFTDIIDNTCREYVKTGSNQVKEIRLNTAILDDIRKSSDENLEKLMVEYDDSGFTEDEPDVPEAVTEKGWEAFRSALSDVQHRAIAAVLNGNTNEIQTLARASGVMPEVLIERINNLALEYTGDYLIEQDDEIKIFEEYLEPLMKGMDP